MYAFVIIVFLIGRGSAAMTAHLDRDSKRSRGDDNNSSNDTAFDAALPDQLDAANHFSATKDHKMSATSTKGSLTRQSDYKKMDEMAKSDPSTAT